MYLETVIVYYGIWWSIKFNYQGSLPRMLVILVQASPRTLFPDYTRHFLKLPIGVGCDLIWYANCMAIMIMTALFANCAIIMVLQVH